MWEPISKQEFETLLMKQESELSLQEREAYERYRIPPEQAKIRRSDIAGDESVFVVAKSDKGVLYFDDVEFGFNVSLVDDHNLILQPGGSQYSLAEAIRAWLMG